MSDLLKAGAEKQAWAAVVQTLLRASIELPAGSAAAPAKENYIGTPTAFERSMIRDDLTGNAPEQESRVGMTAIAALLRSAGLATLGRQTVDDSHKLVLVGTAQASSGDTTVTKADLEEAAKGLNQAFAVFDALVEKGAIKVPEGVNSQDRRGQLIQLIS